MKKDTIYFEKKILVVKKLSLEIEFFLIFNTFLKKFS